MDYIRVTLDKEGGDLNDKKNERGRFTPVNMHLLLNSMKRMVLSCHKEPFVCIAR